MKIPTALLILKGEGSKNSFAAMVSVANRVLVKIRGAAWMEQKWAERSKRR